ncbi:MAG TPA: 50S ribosomal protein L35 [Candidatus Paceibacterota bacterium]|nr:50S ribosomal protein L35 [Candidatus Paceibacterota bacterium]
MSHMQKTNKSLAKRIKVTGTGKITKRKPGQNHFNAKNSGAVGLHKKGSKSAPQEYFRQFQALSPEKL